METSRVERDEIFREVYQNEDEEEREHEEPETEAHDASAQEKADQKKVNIIIDILNISLFGRRSKRLWKTKLPKP